MVGFSGKGSASLHDGGMAVCPICPHHCRLQPGALGICRARRNVGGTVVCDNYGKLTALALDLIEKKPLADYRPGTTVLSLGSYGCNLHCPFCQNADLAAARPGDIRTQNYAPADIVKMALSLADRGCIGIAYTYNEPVVSFEFVRDTAQLAHEAGLDNILVSNGMICAEPLAELAPLIDAANIDLKAGTQRFYDLCGGDLETVKNTIAYLDSVGCHVEVTTLVIPDENDTLEEIEDIATWLAGVNPAIPYHLTRFFPCYKMVDKRPTSISLIFDLVKAASRHLHTVHTGNF